MDKEQQKNYVLAISFVFIVGILLGIAGTKLLTKEKVCDKCPDCVCQQCETCARCAECVCTPCVSAETSTIRCNEPGKFDCFPSRLNANVTAITVTCSDGSQKEWLCQENKWRE